MNVGDMMTAGGHRFDEATSAMQKCIRRGMEFEAVYFAQELDSKFSKYVWSRLRVIAHEDIGVVDVRAMLVFDMCKRHHAEAIAEGKYDPMYLINAVLALCRAKPKSRGAAELASLIYCDESLRLEVPDIAKDQHTKAGRAMGRGPKHFRDVGCQVSDEWPSPYKGRAFAFYLANPRAARAWLTERINRVKGRKAKPVQGTLL